MYHSKKLQITARQGGGVSTLTVGLTVRYTFFTPSLSLGQTPTHLHVKTKKFFFWLHIHQKCKTEERKSRHPPTQNFFLPFPQEFLDALTSADPTKPYQTNKNHWPTPPSVLPTYLIYPYNPAKNITGYQRDLLKMRADHTTSLLPNPIVVLDQRGRS